VLVLDEPTRGIDVASKAQIYRLIDELVCGEAVTAGDGDASSVVDLHREEAGRPVPPVARLGSARASAKIAAAPEAPRGQGRKSVLLVSSYLPELLGVCDRIAVMSRGRLGPARPVEEWTEHSLLMEASGARAAS